MVYAAVQLHVLASVSETEKDREAFIASVERGEKPLDPRQSLSLLRVGLDVETNAKQRKGLTRVEGPLAALNRRDECLAVLFRLAHAGEHMKLHRRVHHPRDHEDEHDRRRDQEQLFVEAHSCNCLLYTSPS